MPGYDIPDEPANEIYIEPITGFAAGQRNLIAALEGFRRQIACDVERVKALKEEMSLLLDDARRDFRAMEDKMAQIRLEKDFVITLVTTPVRRLARPEDLASYGRRVPINFGKRITREHKTRQVKILR